MIRRRLTKVFYAWLLLVGIPIGGMTGFAASHGAGAWRLETIDQRPDEDLYDFWDRRGAARARLERTLAPLTIPLGIAVAMLVFYRIALRKSVIAISDDVVTIAGIFSTQTHAATGVVDQVRRDVISMGFVREQVITIRFDDGRQAHLRTVFIANAEEIAAALTSVSSRT